MVNFTVKVNHGTKVTKLLKNNLCTVWRETLAVGKFGKFTARTHWWKKIW